MRASSARTATSTADEALVEPTHALEFVLRSTATKRDLASVERCGADKTATMHWAATEEGTSLPDVSRHTTCPVDTFTARTSPVAVPLAPLATAAEPLRDGATARGRLAKAIPTSSQIVRPRTGAARASSQGKAAGEEAVELGAAMTDTFATQVGSRDGGLTAPPCPESSSHATDAEESWRWGKARQLLVGQSQYTNILRHTLDSRQSRGT